MASCDCLNHCGDDPGLHKGKAKHCQDWLEREFKLQISNIANQVKVEILAHANLANFKRQVGNFKEMEMHLHAGMDWSIHLELVLRLKWGEV